MSRKDEWGMYGIDGPVDYGVDYGSDDGKGVARGFRWLDI